MSDLEWWSYVDDCLQKTIKNYKDIHTIVRDHRQPIFIDLIIRLTIIRVQTNIKMNKLLTAKKILGVADMLINKIKDKDHPLSIVGDYDPAREGSFSMPVSVLE